jgi:dipeptidyl aminopeptidase/acylaminoacyl peptidase
MAIAIMLALAGRIPPASAAPSCAAQLLAAAPVQHGLRPVTARDLVGLRDFGSVETAVGEQAFSVSPDGRSAALILRRADPDTDSHCFGVALVALDRHAPPRLLDTGGEFIQATGDIRGIPAIPSGSPKSPPPVWSPNGHWLAYLRRDHGVTRVWRVGLDGRPAQAVGRCDTDALAMRWSADGQSLLVTIRPALDAGRAAIEREGRAGFHYDERFWALSEARPQPPLPLDKVEVAIDPRTGRLQPAVSPPDPAPRASVPAVSSSGARAWTAPEDEGRPWGAAPLHVTWRGRTLPCPGDICGSRVAGLWWLPGDTLLFMKGGRPENGGRLALYRWRVGVEAAPILMFETTDALLGCQLAGAALICAHESAVQPREIVALDPATGHRTTLFDPNPEFARLRLGTVERLSWRGADGVSTFGDLVLPPDHKPGQRHPLIVVQYISRGFLRGGTGDEYPIHLLAAHGYAVLSFQRPGLLAGTAQARDLNALQRVNIAGWAERRMIVGALEAGVDTVIAHGLADPARVGLTGMSDGATTTQFALNHSARFSAAAISSCCDEPSGLYVVGPAYGDATLAWGYPPPGRDREAFWAPMSLAARAATWRTPLLIQVPDMEYRLGLETVSALQLAGAPVDMYVFPDEHHLKWHPAHRLAVYERSLAWFNFWLKGERASDTGRQDELARWTAMERRLSH